MLSFDEPAKWQLTNGTATLSGEVLRTEGTGALGVRPANGGWIRVQSNPSQGSLQSSTLLALDLFRPSQQIAGWRGDVQLYVDVPSAGMTNAYVGQVALDTVPPGLFSTLSFAVPAPVRAAIDMARADARFSVVLNLPSGVNDLYRLDNLRFVNAAPPGPEPDPAEHYARVVGFEHLPDWSSSTTGLVIGAGTGTQGERGLTLSRGEGGWMEIRSIPVYPQEVSDKLLLDLRLPSFQPNPAWYGVVELSVSAPSAGLNSAYVGQVALTGLPLNAFNTVEFAVPLAIRQAIPSARGDLTFRLALNVPYGASGQYHFDNLRFKPQSLLGFEEPNELDPNAVAAAWPDLDETAVECQGGGALGGDYWNHAHAPLRDNSPSRVGNCFLDVTEDTASASFSPPGAGSAVVVRLRARTPLANTPSSPPVPPHPARLVLEQLSSPGVFGTVQEASLAQDAKWVEVSFTPVAAGGPLRLRIVPAGGVVSVDGVRSAIVAQLPNRLKPSAPASPATAAPMDVPHVWGVADTHTHPENNLAFGGGLIAGDPDDPSFGVFHRGGIAQGIVMDAWSPGHKESGFPDFREWPTFWDQSLHNQMHVQWLERAWKGGMRLIVASAVNNQLLARYFLGETQTASDRSDMQAVRNQIAALKTLVQNHDFMRIAFTPSDARNAIADGKLALVLGAEIDDIGACHAVNAGVYPEQNLPSRRCTTPMVEQALDELEALGVRHIFPVHLTDNDFGGAALYEEAFNLFQQWSRMDLFCMETAPAASQLSLNFDRGINYLNALLTDLLISGAGSGCAADGFQRNSRSLTDFGRFAIQEMWDRKMVVDVDHMSEKTRTAVLSEALGRVSGVVSGHTGFREQGKGPEWHDAGDKRHENSKSVADLQAIRQLGGVIGVGTGPGNVNALSEGAPDTLVPNGCAGSSTTWLQRYAYANRKMSGRGVAIGTDMGLTSQVFPRFGVWACGAGAGAEAKWHTAAGHGLLIRHEAEQQTSAVSYDSPLHSYHSRRFMRGDGDEGSFTFRGATHGCFVSGSLTQVGQTQCDMAGYNPYNRAERAFWQALVFFENGADPNDSVALQPLDGNGLNWGHEVELVRHFTLGLHGLEIEAHDNCSGNFGCGERRAAFLVSRGQPMATNQAGDVIEPGQVQQHFESLKRVWNAFHRMVGESGNASAPLERCVTGNREFDYNIDGLAHYGLLPDMFQDVSNQLRHAGSAATTTHLGTLFASANDFIDAWERLYAEAEPETEPPTFDQVRVTITNGDGTLGESQTRGILRLLGAGNALVGPDPSAPDGGVLNADPTEVWGGLTTHERTFALVNRLALSDVSAIQFELTGQEGCGLSCKNWTIKDLHVRLVDSASNAQVCLVHESSAGNGNWGQSHVARLQAGGGERRPGWLWNEVTLSPVGCSAPALTAGGIPSDPADLPP
ncbi:MAG TPA: hypothetical protein VGK73_18155 [Polyangiaceae bacterium]